MPASAATAVNTTSGPIGRWNPIPWSESPRLTIAARNTPSGRPRAAPDERGDHARRVGGIEPALVARAKRERRPACEVRKRWYCIQDNLSANWTPDIRAFAATTKIELVATPTYASYLNPVECHFFPISEFVVNNADYVDWHAFDWALGRHICHRNGPHRDKRIPLLEARHQIVA